MSSTLDRLRRLQGLREQKKRRDPEPSAPASLPAAANVDGRTTPSALSDVVEGEVIENHAGTCFVSTRRYSLDSQHGPQHLGALLEQEPALFAPFHPNFNLNRARDYMGAAFIDTETTGLGGGAGVYAFMVGVGTFELGIGDWGLEIAGAGEDDCPSGDNPQSPIPNPQFVVRQFFMRNPAEEGALLVALADLLSGYELTVTFNGRTFDLPLLRARFQMNHWLFPGGMEDAALLASDRAHLDLLHPARKLWKRRLPSCRLISLEDNILGLRRDEADVPGYLIPQLYSDYVRNGDATSMADVFYHNREDIVSMVALADALGRVYTRTPAKSQAGDLHGADWLSLGRAYEQLDQHDQAEAAYRLVIDGTLGTGPRAEAFARLGRMLKRQARWGEATETWQQWLTSIGDKDHTPYVELAKYCEWRIKDLEQAEMWAGWAVHNLRAEPVWQQNRALLAELEHRLARIQRKRKR